MGYYFQSWWTELCFSIFLGVFAFFAYYKLVIAKYWKNRNVPHVEPNFIIGNLWIPSLSNNFVIYLNDLYRKWKSKKIVGIWSFSTPVLVVCDLELIKNIMIRDFHHFHSHRKDVTSEYEPITGHLFNLSGTKWKNMRVKLTPTFTSGKMKMMFPMMVKCGDQLQKYLVEIAGKEEIIEVKDILSRFTTDIISTCAFGIETNSIRNPDSEFRVYGKKIFKPRISFAILNFILESFPKLYYMLKFRLIPEDITEFFTNSVRETIEYREKKQIKRNDFLDLLIQLMKKGKLDDVDHSELSTGEAKQETDTKFTFDEAVAQAFVFFAAGFETSSTTQNFALYELALNTDIQTKLQNEIDNVLSKYDGKITYEGIMEMEYLDWVVQETLRKHPAVPFLIRECNKEYPIPELNTKVDEGRQVFIPIHGIHMDPEIFPNPERFDPDRFSQEEKLKRNNFNILTFGDGPRKCIGDRFGLLQTKVGLISILSKLNVKVTSRIPVPMKYDKNSFILTPEEGMYLKFELRSN